MLSSIKRKKKEKKKKKKKKKLWSCTRIYPFSFSRDWYSQQHDSIVGIEVREREERESGV